MELNKYKELLQVEMDLTQELCQLIDELLTEKGISGRGKSFLSHHINNYEENRYLPPFQAIFLEDESHKKE